MNTLSRIENEIGQETFTQVVTLACKYQKPTKRECLNIVENLAFGKIELDQNSLSILYSYFLPAKKKTAKNDFDWCFKASAKNDTREYLNECCYSRGGYLYASDGHRLNRIPTNLKEGFYNIKGDYFESDYKYPHCERVIPKTDKIITLDIENLNCVAVKGIDLLAVHIADGLHVQREYLMSALNGRSNFEVEYKDKNTSIKIVDGDRVAVIMPIRV